MNVVDMRGKRSRPNNTFIKEDIPVEKVTKRYITIILIYTKTKKRSSRKSYY